MGTDEKSGDGHSDMDFLAKPGITSQITTGVGTTLTPL
jgi:hypothetical protein